MYETQEQPQNINVSGKTFDARGFASLSALEIRLDTDPLKSKIELFLRGEDNVVRETQEGKIKVERVKIGKRICNDEGVQQICKYVESVFNSQGVQGNYTIEMYSNHIYQIRKRLAFNLVLNYPKWEMDYNTIEMVIDVIMNLAKTFLSRLIDNKERESYADTIKSIESSTINQQKTGLFK